MWSHNWHGHVEFRTGFISTQSHCTHPQFPILCREVTRWRKVQKSLRVIMNSWDLLSMYNYFQWYSSLANHPLLQAQPQVHSPSTGYMVWLKTTTALLKVIIIKNLSFLQLHPIFPCWHFDLHWRLALPKKRKIYCLNWMIIHWKLEKIKVIFMFLT